MSNPLDLLDPGDHVQIFQGKHDPDDGSPREVMVIWSHSNELKWNGPIDRRVLEMPGVVVRRLSVRISMKMQRNFRVTYKNPLDNEGV